MIRSTIIFCCLALIAAVAPIKSSYAQSNDDINPWLHCGIGAVIFSNNETVAAISNIIWDLGTTAVSSKVSSPDSCEGARVNTALFIRQTYPQLAVETAKGEGEHLTAVAELMGCNETAHTSFIRQVRTDMAANISAADFATLDDVQKAEQYFYIVDSLAMGEYSAVCSAT